jgi:hypothetical protein
MSQLSIQIAETNRTIYMPLQLGDCNQEQYISFCDLMYRLENGALEFSEFKILATYALLGLKKGTRKIGEDEVDHALANIALLSQYVLEFFDRNEENISLKLEYKNNHIEKIDTGTGVFYGPQQYFIDCDYGQYEDALDAFFSYNKYKNIASLQKLCSIFYHKKNAAPYISLGLDDLKAHRKNFKNLHIGYLYGFFYTFAAFHTYFSSSGVMWEGKEIDMSIIFKEQPEDESSGYESPYPSLGLKSTAFELAESGVFGTLKEVRSTKLWEIAFRLYDVRKRDLDYQAQTKTKK